MATVRPMARKDVFFAGSVLHLAESQESFQAPSEQALAKYRHSVISMHRSPSKEQNPLPRGSIVASHLSLRREVIDPDIVDLKLDVSQALW